MFCTNCGKEVTAGSKFCPNCGTALAGTQESPVTKETVTTAKDTKGSSPQANFKFDTPKLIGSFVFGIILSVATAFLISVSFIRLLLTMGVWIVLGAVIFFIVEAITHSKVFGFLGGVSGALLLGTFLISRYYEAVEAADTGFDVFLVVLVGAIVYTFFVYLFASVENRPSPPAGDSQDGEDTTS